MYSTHKCNFNLDACDAMHGAFAAGLHHSRLHMITELKLYTSGLQHSLNFPSIL